VLTLDGSFHMPSGASDGSASSRAAECVCPASVWGPTCDSIDCVCAETELPCALRVGDWLGWDDMGAYTVCSASQFNGFEVSKVVYTAGVGSGAREVRETLLAFAASAAPSGEKEEVVVDGCEGASWV
jgi:ornithine decarboxylase